MTCQQAQTNLSLYLYGELDFAQEEALEQHLQACAFCQHALAREKEWHVALNSEMQDVSFELLSECRRELRIALHSETPTHARFGWVSRLLPAGLSSTRWSAQVAAASLLVFAGFAAARLMDSGRLPSFSAGNISAAGLLDSPTARIRDIQPNGANGVRIVVDRLQQQEVTGNVNDDAVRRLLMIAMRDPSDPGIRVNSVELLQHQSGTDVRDALLNSARNDANAAVRIKALEGLRQFGSDPVTRQTIEAILKNDSNADVRSEAIDILVPSDRSTLFLTPDVLTTLQEIQNSERDSDDYVRARSAQVLHALNAASPVY